MCSIIRNIISHIDISYNTDLHNVNPNWAGHGLQHNANAINLSLYWRRGSFFGIGIGIGIEFYRFRSRSR
jgi:hypothetical protein